MIVKNETAILERCLRSVAGSIACWVIGDTGSTDGTQDLIRAFFAERGIPGELHSFPFYNFEQARNAALDRAYATPLEYDYLLFADADMELVVEDADFRSKLSAAGYRLLQRSGVSYWNVRMVRRDAGARYHGVTHEYLDVPGQVDELHGVWYKDYASGSNRVDKFERDIRLLTEALATEPGNHRYWFYLAQSQRDAGQYEKAAETYGKRADMGGWEEEAWYARLQQARCFLNLKDEGQFLEQALAAYDRRPTRAEPLYELARFFREQGMNDASVLFCEPALRIAKPTEDILFVEDYVYDTGLYEEYSIAANYAHDPVRKDRGHAACEYLTLSRLATSQARDLARSTLRYYLHSAAEMMPSFVAKPVDFTPPTGFSAMNPSAARRGYELLLIQRTVNYNLVDEFQYQTPDDGPIRTRNYLLRLDAALGVTAVAEILPPADLPPPQCAWIEGFEDCRLFEWRGELWCSSTMRELTTEAWCQQVLAKIVPRPDGQYQLADWRVISPDGQHEKNWMPQVNGDELRFIYSCDPTRIVDERGTLLAESMPPFAGDWFRGGSQAVPFDNGWLVLVHEARVMHDKRYYLHNFLWFDAENELRLLSRRFYFQKIGIEFAAGMCWHPDGQRLVISFGVVDKESWIGTVAPDDVRRLLHDIETLRQEIHGPSTALPAIGEVSEDALATGQTTMIEDDIVIAQAEEKVASTADDGPDASRLYNTSAAYDIFHDLAPFLHVVDSPDQRRDQSRAFDSRIAPYLDPVDISTLPLIHCFYEVLSEQAQHTTLLAAIGSMRAAGHRVRVWSYTPDRLSFLQPTGAELCNAADVVPHGLFNQVLQGSEIRYFSDIFRYAVLYEHGGLWMDGDVILLRPFPFRGDFFFNLQWRGSHVGHFICGNVLYAKPFSHHLRALYERSLERFFGPEAWAFGDIGPKLLSDYIGSDDGAALRDWVFSPMFFNAIDWLELDRFERPLSALGPYLNDDRVFGVHLWNNRTQEHLHETTSLASLLLASAANFPSLAQLADQLGTDKNRVSGNQHFYARIYDRLLMPMRLSLRSLVEIGVCVNGKADAWSDLASSELWLRYFPFAHVTAVDLQDLHAFDGPRFTSFICDQSKIEDLRSVAGRIERGSVDVVIDDGSHASYDQQASFREFFDLLRPGGLYVIENLDWQPPGDPPEITLTKQVFRELQQFGLVQSSDPLGLSALAGEIAEILFFDSQFELDHRHLLGGLVAIRKRDADR